MSNNPTTGSELAVMPPQALARKVEPAQWNALKELYDGASDDMIGLVTDYCTARRLDPLKKPVHIVPVWSSRRKCMVETLWPSIAETRITAMRTGKFAGLDETKYGPTINMKVGNSHDGFAYPEWAQVTVYRMVDGQRCGFPGPRVYWIEAYATKGKDDYTPNSMWLKRTWGQLDKAAEAAALRRAFPEELGGIATAEEMHGKAIDDDGLQNVTGTAAAPALMAGGEVKRAAVPGKLAKGAAALAPVVPITTPPAEPTPPVTVTVSDAQPPANAPETATTVAPQAEPEKKRTRRSKEQIAADEAKAAEAKAAAAPAETTVTATAPAPVAPPPDSPPAAETSTPPVHAPAPAAKPEETPEWPKVVVATVDECVVKTTKNPKYPQVKVCLLGGNEIWLNGQMIPVRSLGRLIFDPAVEGLDAFSEVSDKEVEFKIVEVPSPSNPQVMNRMIVAARAVGETAAEDDSISV